MKIYLLTLFAALSLYAQNPLSFAAFGDTLYNDTGKFKQIAELWSMVDQKPAIEKYIASAERAKQMGFAVDNKEEGSTSKAYLEELRKLSIEHDAIISTARERFSEAIEYEDGETITRMITIGLIDPEEYKSRLIQYYEEFSEEQNLSVIEPLYRASTQKTQDEQPVGQFQQHEQNISEPAMIRPTKSNKELIERMRAQDRARTEAFERAVNEEKEREKEKVMEKQKKELGIE